MADSTKLQLITSPQTLTASWADLGNPIIVNTSNYAFFTVWLGVTVNTSINIQCRALADIDGTIKDFPLPIRNVLPNKVRVDRLEYINIEDGIVSGKIPLLQFEVDKSIPLIHVQVRTDTVGGTAGTIDTAHYTIGYIN